MKVSDCIGYTVWFSHKEILYFQHPISFEFLKTDYTSIREE